MTTPSPGAIEAAEAAVRKYYSAGGWVRTADVAKLAVEAAYPLMEAQAKAEALREAAEKLWPESLTDAVPRTEADRTARVIAVTLRRSATTIESEAAK